MSPSQAAGSESPPRLRLGPARLFSPLGDNLWLFVLAHLSHHVCTGILVPMLPFIRADFSLNYFMSGMLVSGFNFTYGLSQIPLGRLADRLDKRFVIIAGLIGLGVATMVTGLAQNYYLLMAFLMVMALLGGTYHPSAAPALVQRFPLAQRGRALGLHFVGGNLSFFVAPLAAGLIAQTWGWRGAYILLGIPAVIVALLFRRLMGKPSIALSEAAGKPKAPGVGLRDLARALGILIVVTMISHVAFSPVNAYLPLYMVDKHGVDRAVAGMLVGLINGAGILAAPFGGMLSDRIGRKPVIVISVAAAGPLLYLLTNLSFGPFFLAVLLAMGFAVTLKIAVIESLLADVVPRERLSSIMGVYYFLGQEINGLSTPAAGFLIDMIGLNTVFTMLAVLALLTSGLVFLIRGKA
ncbi:MAG: MFS transporter [Chloroflexi bacterium]|nr:MFS transporter [Chloroflexota bacterium]